MWDPGASQREQDTCQGAREDCVGGRVSVTRTCLCSTCGGAGACLVYNELGDHTVWCVGLSCWGQCGRWPRGAWHSRRPCPLEASRPAEGSLTATSWLCWARVGKGCLSTVGGGRELLLGRWWSGLDMHSLLGRGALGCDGLRAAFLKPWLCWGGLRCPGGAPGRREVA